MALFVEDCMEQGDYEERTSAVYQRYRTWCQENGHYPESMKNFRQSLETVATIVRKRPQSGSNKTTMVTGYRLISDFWLSVKCWGVHPTSLVWHQLYVWLMPFFLLKSRIRTLNLPKWRSP